MKRNRKKFGKVKEELEKEHIDTKEFLTVPRHVKIIKILLLLLIPLFIFEYLILTNFLISHEFSYFYDIGAEDDNYLTPLDRISESFTNEARVSYRNLTSGLVYFDVPIPRGAEKVKVKVKFKDNFPDSKFILGAKDQEVWHYRWNTLYNPFLDNLSEFYIGSGVYKISQKSYYKDFNISEGFIIGVDTNSKLDIVPRIINDYSADETLITTSLRGGHTFYIYASGDLEIEIKKQDINWYNGSDELDISLLDVNGSLISNLTISDDGVLDNNKLESEIQIGVLKIPNLAEGVYKLEFSNFDGLIREIKINTNKIVVSNKIFLADSDIYIKGIEKPSVLYTEFMRPSEISFKTWHNSALQTVYVNNKKVHINEKINSRIFSGEVGGYTIKSNKNDIIIETLGYFAFSKKSYFEPFKNRVVQIKNDKEWVVNNLDYVITDYFIPKKEGEWVIAETEFYIDDLYIKDNKLSIAFNVPHLSRDEFVDYTIPIDWINITVYKSGILK